MLVKSICSTITAEKMTFYPKKKVVDKKTGKEKEISQKKEKYFLRFTIISTYYNPDNGLTSESIRSLCAHRCRGAVRVSDSATDHQDRHISHYFNDDFGKLLRNLADNKEVVEQVLNTISGTLVRRQPMAEAA